MVPGRTLHRLATRLCSSTSLSRIVEPALADLQKEFADATRNGGGWHGWRVLFLGYLGLAKALAIYSGDRLLHRPLSVGADDSHILWRTLGWGVLASGATAVAMMIPPLQNLSSRGFNGFYLMALIPQALPLAIPVGLTLGVLAGFDGRPMTHRHRRYVLGVAAACAVASFVILCWVMPAANQEFRVRVMQADGGGYPVKGTAEMTLSELSREIRVAAASGLPDRERELSFAYYLRSSLASGVIALVFLASTVSMRGLRSRLAFGVVACGLYWMCLFAGDQLSRGSTLPVLLGAWLPNLVFIGTAGLLTMRRPPVSAAG